MVAIEEVMPPDKSSKAAGQVFEPDRPHKSLHVLGRRPKTKALVTGLKAARASDMPSKPVWGESSQAAFLWIVIVRVSVFTIGLAGSVLAATSGLVDPDAVSGDARDQRTGDSPRR
jgi:hypothetical protein